MNEHGNNHANGQSRAASRGKTVSTYSPQNAPGKTVGGLVVTVLFTDTQATLKALANAADLASELDASIGVLVPYVVPYPLPIEKAAVNPAFKLRKLIVLCEQQPIEVRIDIWLCRDVLECILDGLPQASLVVIGNRRTWWPFTSEKRLARKLSGAGHQVVAI